MNTGSGIASLPTLSSRQNLYTFSIIVRLNVVAVSPYKIRTKMFRSFKGKENIPFWEMAAPSVGRMFSLCFGCLWCWLFPVLVLGAAVGFWLLQFLIFACFLLIRRKEDRTAVSAIKASPPTL